MDAVPRIGAALVGIASLALAARATGTPYFDLCDSASGTYHDIVEQRMREALPTEVEPLVIRYALPLQTETGIGITRSPDGFHLVRLVFDRSLWYDSWVDVEDVPEDIDLSTVDGFSEIVYREDGGPLGYEIQDFSRVEPRVAILSIPISDGLANELVDLLESFDPASEDEQSNVVMVDGATMELFQMNGRCLSVTSMRGTSASTQLMELMRFLEDDMGMGAWRAWRKDAFETQILSMIKDVQAAQ